MQRHYTIRLLAAGLLVSWFIIPQAQAADLLQIYHQAQQSDPTLEAARYTLEATQQKIPQARAGLLPTVNLNGNTNRTSADTTYAYLPASPFLPPTVVSRNINAWTWNLQLTQPLIRLQNLFAYGESKHIVEQAEAQYATAEQDLILRTAQAYFDILTAQESIATAESQLRAMEEQQAVARHSFDAGAASITDVHEAKSKADLARAQRLAALNELENKRAELEKLIGTVPEHLAALKAGIPTPKPQPEQQEPWVEQARTLNPAVRAQQAALSAAESDINRNRAEHLPTLDLTASTGSNYSSASPSTPQNYSTDARSSQIGLQLTIPLYAGGATNSKVTEAIANKDKTRAQLEETSRKAAADAKQAYVAIINGLAQIDALESAVESGNSSVKGNKIGYQLGIRINSDVLAAEQQLYTSQRDLVKARHDTLLQGLKLKAAAGVLTEADLEGINGLLAE